MSGSSIIALSLLLLVAGCSSSEPRLHQPDHVDGYCGDQVAIPTAIESIVASTSDAAESAVVPSAAQIRKDIEAGGVIAHWNDQPLYLPVIARAVGADGDYVTLGDAAIGAGSSGLEGSDARRIYVTLKTKTGPRTFALRAFDVQDVCNEGKLKS